MDSFLLNYLGTSYTVRMVTVVRCKNYVKDMVCSQNKIILESHDRMKEGKKSTVGHCSDYKSLTVLKGLRQNVRIGMKCGAGQNGNQL